MTGQQLKNSILQMAVQGKLVPQDPNDEPASVLLERIRKEKEQLIKDGKIKKEKNPSIIFRGADNLPYEKVGDNEPVCIADQVPFDIPDSWEWCRVGDLFTNMSGLSYKKEFLSKKTDKMIRVLRGGNIGNEFYSFKNDDVFISGEYVKTELLLKKNYMITPSVSSLEHIGKIALVSQDYEDVVVGGFVLMLIPFFNDDIISKYLLYAFATKYHRDNCRNITHKSGQAFYNLSREKLMNLPIPFPPYAEMKRIIIKLSTLLSKANEYSKIEKENLILNNSFPDSLKKSILQEAVQGKLVPQDPNDEPASVLLERIRAEKQALIKAGKIKKDKNESIIFRRDNSHYEKRGSEEVCIDDEIPFEIPDTWEWIKLSDLTQFVGGYAYKSKTFIERSEYQVLRLGNVKNDEIRHTAKPVFISKELAEKTANFRCKPNDILLTMTGTRLKKDYFYTVVVSNKDTNYFLNQRVGCLREYYPNINKWLIWVLKSEGILSQVFKYETGTANQGNLGAENIMKTFIPLPPLNEQNRICNMIERLLKISSAL